MSTELIPLSASRISTLKSCTWKYYCGYILKLPEATNQGACMGTVCHTLFECLGNPRHKKTYDKIINANSVEASDSCIRLLKKNLKKLNVFTDDNFKLVKNMCLNGIKYDFFAQRYKDAYGNADLEESEASFDIIKNDGDSEYRIKGFIDKLWLFKNKTCALIRDFKSSKKMYSEKEFEENMQNLMYVLAVKHLYPEIIKQRVEFLFLQFDLDNGNGVMKGHDLIDEELSGFESFLTQVQKIINNFDERAGKSDMAKYQKYDKGGGFKGPIMCGKAEFPGQLKKNGEKAYHCPFKFAFDYYVLVDTKTQKIIASRYEQDAHELFEIQEDGQEVFKKRYGGCPAWANLNKSS